jgi:predicted Zn-dependent protease
MHIRTLRYALLSTLLFLGLSESAAADSLSPATYRTLEQVQTAMTDGDWSGADSVLEELIKDLNPGLGLALSYQMQAQIALAQERMTDAEQSLENALALDALPSDQHLNLSSNLAQIYLAGQERREQRTKKAESLLFKAIATAESQATAVPPSTFALLAICLQIQQRYGESIPWLNKAINTQAALQKLPEENWLVMLASALYQTKSYNKAAQALGQLTTLKPNNENYWLQRASMYQLLEQPQQQLAVLELAYAGGYLTQESSLIALAQLLIAQGVPERAARLLQQWLADNDKNLTVSDSEANIKLLATAWQLGREDDDAAIVLSQAAIKTNEPQLAFYAMQLAVRRSDCVAAEGFLSQAQELGLDSNKKGDGLLLVGGCAFDNGDKNTARRYFQQALGVAGSAVVAQQWLAYLPE